MDEHALLLLAMAALRGELGGWSHDLGDYRASGWDVVIPEAVLDEGLGVVRALGCTTFDMVKRTRRPGYP